MEKNIITRVIDFPSTPLMRNCMKILIIPLLTFIPIQIIAAPGVITEFIKIDQFGYRCTDQKIAIISNPITGYNNGTAFAPGTGANNYQVRRWSDDAVMFSGTLVAWNGGATHTQSGDKVWWFDFSAFTTSGSYYIYDVTKAVGSYQFDIRDDVYADVLKNAVRTFYYQRCGTSKSSPYAGTGWTDPVCHAGTQQDTDCRLYNNTNVSTSKNLSGGWHDAGDYNKYVNFTFATLVDMLLAYEENPSVWLDNYNIPESGNGIPDLLDEIKYEMDWLLKMQQVDGSVLSIVGGGSASPPSSDGAARRYGPANTSAALTTASVCALAAIQYRSLGIPAMTTYANTLQTAAINAWNWAVANPAITFNNSGLVGAGEQEISANDRAFRKLCASAFLYAATANATYKTYFEANYNAPPAGGYWYSWPYATPFQHTYQDAMLYYSKTVGVTAAVSTNIKNVYNNSVRTNADHYVAFTAQTDAYRAYLKDADYTWGSNSIKASQGSMFLTMNTYSLDVANSAGYTNAASGFLHYLHGVNPTAFVYLSNMSAYGAEKSINEFYHTWFSDGSALWDRVGTSTYGPAPGFVTGGPNPSYSVDGCCPSGCGSAANNSLCAAALVTPPLSQPRQKSYRDWNTNWPQNSWSVTENAIYYQAAYIRLLSRFTGGSSCGSLPVTLLVFNANISSDKTVILKWETTSEKNNDFFVVEKSNNGKDFQRIGVVKGSVNSSLVNSYNFVDMQPSEGTNYYRLKQVDLDGSISYSEVINIENNSSNGITIFPNPSNNVITINLTSGNISQIQIYDLLGKLIYSNNILNSGSNEVSIDVSYFNSGCYFIHLITDKNKWQEKFIKNDN
jgi:endoglucanase